MPPLPAVCSPAEDVEDQLGPVDDFEVRHGRDRSGLRGRKVLIEDEEIHPVLKRLDHHLLQLAASEEILGMNRLWALNNRVQHDKARGASQIRQFHQRLFLIGDTVSGDADQNRLFLRVVDQMRGPGPAQFLFESTEKLPQMHVALLQRDRLPDFIGFAGRIRRKNVRGVQLSRLAVCLHADGRHQIEPQERQVRQIVLTQRLVAQVRVDQPETTERSPPQTIVRHIRQDDLPVVADDHVLDRPPSVD